MALPIKPKDTQDGCNPISSNCVTWQGPDIPCINLCNGDSVSDVVAKLAEELCTIVDQLDINILDISCFGALAPEPSDFRDVIQLLINKVCNLEAGSGSGSTPSAGCPDDCLIPVATCLQFTDPLGNTVTELVLRDYLILIANRLCTLISQVNTLSSAVTDLQNRVTVIEQELANPTDNTIIVTSGNCIGKGTPTAITAFVIALETALCSLIAAVGSPTQISNAIARQCTPNGRSLDDAAQLSVPGSSMSNIPGWVSQSSYTTLADAVNNLWLTVCDMRATIQSIQATLTTCCSLSCNDVDWDFAATGVTEVKNVTLNFTGNIPSTFDYCTGTTAPVIITNSLGQSGTYNRDVIAAINSGSPEIIPLNTNNEFALWYNVRVSLCVTDGTNNCTTVIDREFYSTAWCAEREIVLGSNNVIPASTGTLYVDWTASNASTTYQIKLYLDNGNPTPTQIGNTVSVTYTGGTHTYAFPGTFPFGNTYFVEFISIQGSKSIECRSSTIPIAG